MEGLNIMPDLPQFQFEELTCFKLDENNATVMKKCKIKQVVKIIVGTQPGKVIIYTPSTLETMLLSVFERPVLNIFVDEAGNNSYFLITDGREWKAIDFTTLAFVEVDIPNGTFGVGWAKDEYIICQEEGISVKSSQNEFTSIFKKKQETNYIYESKIELFAHFGREYLFFLDEDDNLRAINIQTQKQVKFEQYNNEIANFVERPCKCGCFPSILVMNGAVILSWHNIILVLSIYGGECNYGLLGKIVNSRKEKELDNDTMMTVLCFVLKDELVNSAAIFDEYVYCLAEGKEQELQVYDASGNMVEYLPLEGEYIEMDLIYANRVFSYIPNSAHRPENFELLLLEKEKVIFAEFEVELDEIMSDVNKIYSICENIKNQPINEEEFEEIVEKTVKELITYSQRHELPEFLDIPDNFISLFLKLFLIKEAHFVLSELIVYTDDPQHYLNAYLTEFANAGVLSMLLPFVPDPASDHAVKNEIYEQILESLLLNDYKSFFEVLEAYSPIYDIDSLIQNIKNSLLIATTTKDEKMDPIWLKKSLIYLYLKIEKPDFAFEYVIDVFDIQKCVKFCIDNNLYKQLLQNFYKFKTDDAVGIIYQVIQKNQNNQQIITMSLHTILGVNQLITNPKTLILSYLRQTYGSEQIHRIQSISQDKNLQNLTELLSILFDNIMLLEESTSVRSTLFDLRHYYLILEKLYKTQPLSKTFLEILLVCCMSAHLDGNGCQYIEVIGQFLISLQCDVEPNYQGIILMIEKYKIVKSYTDEFIDYKCLKDITDCKLLQLLYKLLRITTNEDLIMVCNELRKSKSLVYGPIFALNASFALKYQIEPEILYTILEPLLESNSENISLSLQNLASPMRQILPLDDLLETTAGLDIVRETKEDALFAHACLEVVGADYFMESIKRERAAKRAFIVENECVLCSKSCFGQNFFVMFCGHCIHEACSQKWLKEKGWTGLEASICPECESIEEIQKAMKQGDRWFDLLE